MTGAEERGARNGGVVPAHGRGAKPKKALERVRDVTERDRLLLFVLAGGRCEFDGCPRYLIEHPLTKVPGNFAQVAHICAFSDRGPRPNPALDRRAINAPDNLMLLCPQCHKQVDDDPVQWTVAVLRQHKKAHEDRIYKLTSTRPDRHTVALTLRAQIHGRVPTLSLPEIQDAVAPRYLGERDLLPIDLTNLADDNTASYWQSATAAIRAQTDRFYETPFDSGPVRHSSVFGIARIPLLVYLGSRLSDKVPTTLYQRHRNPSCPETTWRWKDSGDLAHYQLHQLRRGSDPARVALLLSLSGRVAPGELPPELDGTYSLYEFSLRGQEPNLFFLDREESLYAFTQDYLGALDELRREHPGMGELVVVPAVPAPVAIAMGRDLLPARHPKLVIYDLVKVGNASTYIRTIEVTR